MGKLRDLEAQKYLDAVKTNLKNGNIEVYECDKGDGIVAFSAKGDGPPEGWVAKRSGKGAFYYCPNHKADQQQSANAKKRVASPPESEESDD